MNTSPSCVHSQLAYHKIEKLALGLGITRLALMTSTKVTLTLYC